LEFAKKRVDILLMEFGSGVLAADKNLNRNQLAYHGLNPHVPLARMTSISVRKQHILAHHGAGV
jgi:hypothetical protein